MISARARLIVFFFYFLATCILFFLPGNAFPKTGTWMQAIYLDKWVHIGLFGLLCFLGCWAGAAKTAKQQLIIFSLALLYGIIVEGIQHWFIRNRSFDLGDWAADSVGAFVGVLAWARYIKK